MTDAMVATTETHVDKATAWDEIAKKNAEIAVLRAALAVARCYVCFAKDDMRLSPTGREIAAGRLAEVDAALGRTPT